MKFKLITAIDRINYFSDNFISYYKRFFLPESYPAPFDTGESVLKRKLSIRGSGDSVQFVFKAEPQKDLQLLGYSVSYKMRGRM